MGSLPGLSSEEALIDIGHFCRAYLYIRNALGWLVLDKIWQIPRLPVMGPCFHFGEYAIRPDVHGRDRQWRRSMGQQAPAAEPWPVQCICYHIGHFPDHFSDLPAAADHGLYSDSKQKKMVDLCRLFDRTANPGYGRYPVLAEWGFNKGGA